MSSHPHRSVIVSQHQNPKRESTRSHLEAANYVVVMDDRDEEKELMSLLILREDRRRGIPAVATRKHGSVRTSPSPSLA